MISLHQSISRSLNESQSMIVFDELSNPQIKKIAKKLSDMSLRINRHVYDVDILKAFKSLYGLHIVLSWNDITFIELDNIDYLCVNFINGDFERGEYYWDHTLDEWIPYQK